MTMHNPAYVCLKSRRSLALLSDLAWSVCLQQHWIFEVAENEPERLLAMSEDEFREALSAAGFDTDELIVQFHRAIDNLFEEVTELRAVSASASAIASATCDEQ